MSTLHTGTIDQFQQDIVDRLQGDESLAGISVYYEKTKDIGSLIEIALGKLGICIVVTPPVCRATKLNVPGPYLDSVTCEVNVPENVIINQGNAGTKKTASYVAELVAKRLHRHIVNGRCLLCEAILPVADPVLRVYRVPVRSQFGLQ